MGKKSELRNEDKVEAVKSLFGSDNPFRRRPQPDAAVGDTADIAQPLAKLGLVLDDCAEKDAVTEVKKETMESCDSRKRKRHKEIIAAAICTQSSDEEIVPRKRKKLAEESEVNGLKKMKRKRDEVEWEYEKRKYGSLKEDNPVATIVGIGEKRKTDAIVADMFDVKESFDDESKVSRTIFIGNLPLKTKRKALNREFSRFGAIDSVRIRSVPLVDTKAPRKAAIIKGQINQEADSLHAYIVFKEEQSAQSALSHNMMQYGGNHIRVDMARPPSKKRKSEEDIYDRKKTVFVGNLPFDVKDEELYQLFCGISQLNPYVEAVRVIRDPSSSVGKGIAYVLFKTRDAANEVCRRRDLKIRDRNLRVCHARSDTTPSLKAKQASSSSSAAFNAPASSGRIEKRKRAAADSAPYEGVRSSRTGTAKKPRSRPRSAGDSGGVSKKLPSSWRDQQQQQQMEMARKRKRPAVAARKAKQQKQQKQQLLKRKQTAGGGPADRAHFRDSKKARLN